VTRGCSAAAVLQRRATAIVNVARVVAPVHTILSLLCGQQKGQNLPVKYWEVIADKLSKAGWSLGWVSAVDSEGRMI
jgi:hypothetical protein